MVVRSLATRSAISRKIIGPWSPLWKKEFQDRSCNHILMNFQIGVLYLGHPIYDRPNNLWVLSSSECQEVLLKEILKSFQYSFICLNKSMCQVSEFNLCWIPLFSRFLIPAGVGWVAGGSGYFCLHMGPHAHWLASIFYAFKPCRGRCQTSNVRQTLVDIVIFFSKNAVNFWIVSVCHGGNSMTLCLFPSWQAR